MLNNIFWLSIAKIPGIGPKTVVKLYRGFPTLNLKQLISIDFKNQLLHLVKNKKLIEYLTDTEYMQSIMLESEKEISKYKNGNIEVISIADERYPYKLREIEDPPAVLYCRGNIEALFIPKKIAVIGTRNATQKGLNAAAKVAVAFSKLNYAIVSGLAEGIDTAGHIGALEVNGITIAVLPGGVDYKSIYPAKNRRLAERIVENKGLLISEYPPYQRPHKSFFVQRDRIQSGLSLGVCPVQTDVDGGTQHTIKFSQKQNRVLFCPIPTEEGHENLSAYKGIHQLINNKKAIVLNGKDDYEKLDKLMNDSLNDTDKESKDDEKDNIKKIIQTNINDEMQLDIFNYSEIMDTKNQLLELDNVILDLCNRSKELGLNFDNVIEMISSKWELKGE